MKSRKTNWSVSFLSFFFLIYFIGLANADENSTNLAVLDESTRSYPLGTQLEFLEDKEGVLSIGDIESGRFDGKFTPGRRKRNGSWKSATRFSIAWSFTCPARMAAL